jgi:hypothetical protein
MLRPILVVLLACATLAPRPADARSLAIARFDAELLVGRDGQLVVTETLDVRFTGQWNGVVRRLPVRYRTSEGFAYGLRVRVLDATDAGGRPLRTEERRRHGSLELKVWVPDARDVTRTVTIRYLVLRALRFFPDHDEVYWNVTGDEWEAPIETAAARILLPGAAGLTARAFTGARGSVRSDAAVDVRDGAVRVRALRPLPPGQGLTVVVGWGKGIVREPTALEWTVAAMRDNWPLAAPLVVTLLATLVWWRIGRDPARQSIVARWEPPKGLTPADCGALADAGADFRDVTATLVDLAVRGYVSIRHVGGGWVFERRKAPAAWGDLTAYETRLMIALFGTAHEFIDLESLKGFRGHANAMREMIGAHLVSHGLYPTDPAAVRRGWLRAGLVTIAASVVAAWIGVDLDTGPAALVAGGIVTGLVLCGFAFVMPARTLKGARAAEHVLGLKEFLSRVEGDRLARLPQTPETFERLLPYAIALGVEQEWANRFADVYRTPPEWFTGGVDRFDARRLSDDLHALNTSLRTTGGATSTGGGDWTIDVGSSGFSSGGGFSGGGFGGGGGGGF